VRNKINMKRLLLIVSQLIVIIFISGCNTDDPMWKAKRVIRENFQMNLNDYKSYEPVEYGSLVVVKSISEVKQTLDSLFRRIDSETNTEEGSYETWRILQSIDSIRKSVENGPGWKLDHTFRARIPAGGYMLHHYEIYFDPEITKVKKIIDLTEK